MAGRILITVLGALALFPLLLLLLATLGSSTALYGSVFSSAMFAITPFGMLLVLVLIGAVLGLWVWKRYDEGA
jgi:hypothetical protein